MPEAVSRLTPEVCAAIAEEIRAADGNEVFVVGNLDGGGLVAEIFVAARGNESAAPVIQSAVDRAEVLIHNHPSGVLRPSSADLSVASQAASAGLGFYIVDNSVSRVYVVAEPVLTRKKQLLDPSYVSSFLAEDGSLASFSPDYEERPSQIALSAACAAAFNEGKVAMFEAGTGVGKSFAYLLPAVLWSLENQDRVVVSTATIHLQQQLLEKDIPLVQRILGREVRAALGPLQSINSKNADYLEVYVGYPNGAYATGLAEMKVPAGFDTSKRPWYTATASSAQEGLLSEAYMSLTGDIVFAVTRKMLGPDNKLAGIVGIDVSLKSFSAMLTRLNFGKTGHFLVLEGTGRVLCDPITVGNVGKIVTGEDGFLPCTPAGIMELLR